MARWRLIVLSLLVCAGGCASWATTPEEPQQLPQARTASDSVGLEIAFVHLPDAAADTHAAIWSEADEQHFAPELRRQLAANGWRVGILGQNLPSELRTALESATQSLEDRSEDVDTSDVEVNRAPRRLNCRPGRRAKIIVSKTYPSLALLTKDDTNVRGALLDQAQCLLALKAYPQGDGRVKLDITPEVEHGELKTQWVGQEGSLMQRIGRERMVLDQLRLEARLQPGQVLLISTTPTAKGLGEQFFTESAAGRTERTLLVVRVAQTQWDDLFAPEQVTTPLATPGE